jgi:hypothetical protein
LPQVSCDYKLIHFFIPIFLFINTKDKSKKDFAYVLLFALLLIPKNYHLLSKIYDGVIIDPIIMLVLAALIMADGLGRMKWSRRDGHKTSEKLVGTG